MEEERRARMLASWGFDIHNRYMLLRTQGARRLAWALMCNHNYVSTESHRYPWPQAREDTKWHLLVDRNSFHRFQRNIPVYRPVILLFTLSIFNIN